MSAWKILSGCVVGLFLLAGCGRSAATVSGKVTLDGQPLTKGEIAFYPGENGALVLGSIDGNGNYTLSTGTAKGLAPGKYQVTIVANDVLEPTQKFASPVPKLITPAKYSTASTSGLTAEVTAGSNTKNFDLKSTP
jgi:hypothetical protein